MGPWLMWRGCRTILPVAIMLLVGVTDHRQLSRVGHEARVVVMAVVGAMAVRFAIGPCEHE